MEEDHVSSRSPLPVQSEKLCCCIFYASDSAYNFLFKKRLYGLKIKIKILLFLSVTCTPTSVICYYPSHAKLAVGRELVRRVMGRGQAESAELELR